MVILFNRAASLCLAAALLVTVANADPSQGEGECSKHLSDRAALLAEKREVRKYKSLVASTAFHTLIFAGLLFYTVPETVRDNQLFSMNGADAAESNLVIEFEMANDLPRSDGGATPSPDVRNQQELESLAEKSAVLQAVREALEAAPAPPVQEAQPQISIPANSARETQPKVSVPVTPAPVVSPVATPGTGSGLSGAGLSSGAATLVDKAGQGIMNIVESAVQSAAGAEALDIVIAFDVTGSMTPHIQSVKAKMVAVKNRLNELARTGVRVRIAIVAFSDIGIHNPPAWIEEPLSSDLEAVATALQAKIYARPSDPIRNLEGPEDLLDALVLAMNGMAWDPKAQALIITLSDHPPKPLTSYGRTINESQARAELQAHGPPIKVFVVKVN